MTPFSEILIAQLTKTLLSSLLKASGLRLRRFFEQPERARALERCCEAGIVAMVRTAAAADAERDHLHDVLRQFFSSPEIADDLGRAVVPLLKGQHPDLGEMRELLEEAGFAPETLPGFDVESAFAAFEGGFAAAALEQPVLRDEINTHVLFAQLEVQRETRDGLRELARFLLQARPGTATVAAGQITAENVVGTQIIFSSPVLYVPQTQPADETDHLRRSYLSRVMESAGFLALGGVDPAVAASDSDAALRLDAVYTALLTSTPREREEMTERGPRFSSALDQLNQHERLVLLGDPGSGKSTFVSFVALCMAGELVGSDRAHLKLLTEPLAGEKKDDEKTPPPRWDHGPLLPVRVVLRDFAARGLPERGATGTADDLWKFLESELERGTLADYAPHLKETLLRDGGLILLDGLDEVPAAAGQRERILESVRDFVATFHRCRFLVTCRTYAYQHQEWRLPGFAEAVLAPLNEAQIRHFVDRWYAHVAELRALDPGDAQGRAERLKSVILGSDRLTPLAERPLLLTLMASLHAWRGGSLPERREELYHDAVQLLLDFWEHRRVVVDASGKPVVQQESLAEWLRVDRLRVRRFLNELAYKAHASQADLQGTADVARKDLVAGLMALADNPDARPARLEEYLRDRVGLLIERGVGVYSFPHRTFQEYLAACYLTDYDFPEHLAGLARADKERWREVTLLAAAKAARGATATAWHLADALCDLAPDDPRRASADAHGAHLAGCVLAESADSKELSERLRRKLDRVRAWQVDLLQGSELPARDRAECGRSLGRLGDPRPEVTSVEGMQVCWVPAGRFLMGAPASDKQSWSQDRPTSEPEVPYGFWISRFPVTQAQYRVFVEDGGYRREEYWIEAREAGSWQGGAVKIGEETFTEPRAFVEPFGFPNHPVVGVSGYEARAFCRWLADQLSEGWAVDLPSELEWEKAARGGFEIPASAVVTTAGNVTEARTGADLVKNDGASRTFPWGEGIDEERANWNQTGVGTTSAVGCFPRGRSPYGCEEMGGNVWEWTRSGYEEYPYPETREERAERERFDPGARWVLRGGAFDNYDYFVRCAARFDHDPRDRDDYVGFRVVLAPSAL